MQTIQLGWQPAAVLSVGLFAAAAVTPRVARAARPYLIESGIVAALYSLWQLAGTISVIGSGDAFDRGRWIHRFEHDVHLPSELRAQHLISGHPLLTQGANWYYAGVHFFALGAMLLWLFARHRDRYRGVRNVVVLLTASSLLIQLIPVAPPRLLPGFGFVDTAQQYGQSVYNVSGITVDQLAAMPSVHVGWSLLVAWAVISVSRSRHRWWVLAHPVLTVFVVVATANHWWLDGIVAAGLLLLSILVVRSVPLLRGSASRVDHGDTGGATSGHVGEGLPGGIEGDPRGDQLIGPHRT